MTMNHECQIKQWLAGDEGRMQALRLAQQCGLPDWCLAAGFVRNLVWDRLHGSVPATPFNDIDLIYYDFDHAEEAEDIRYEADLRATSNLPWSVKNQARMHLGNGDKPYKNTSDAMSYWVEVETAIGVRLENSGELNIIAPFGVDALFNYTITLNPKRPKQEDFDRRISEKGWLIRWPKLVIKNSLTYEL